MANQNKIDRLKTLQGLLTLIDSPKEGDEVRFILKGDKTKYRGIITKRKLQTGVSVYEIVSKTHPAPKGSVESIEYKGKKFKVGGWKPL